MSYIKPILFLFVFTGSYKLKLFLVFFKTKKIQCSEWPAPLSGSGHVLPAVPAAERHHMDSQGPAVVRNLHHFDNVSGRRVDETGMEGWTEKRKGGGGGKWAEQKQEMRGVKGKTKQRKTQLFKKIKRNMWNNINYKEQIMNKNKGIKHQDFKNIKNN